MDDKDIWDSELEQCFAAAIHYGDLKNIKLLIKYAVTNNILDDINDKLIKAALLSFCTDKPKKKGRPKGKNRYSEELLMACTWACQIKVEICNRDNISTSFYSNRKAKFSGVWLKYNHSMTRHKIEWDNARICASMLNMTQSMVTVESTTAKAIKVARERFELTAEDIQHFRNKQI